MPIKFDVNKHKAGTLLRYTATSGKIIGVRKYTFLLLLDNTNSRNSYETPLRKVFNLSSGRHQMWAISNLELHCIVVSAVK